MCTWDKAAVRSLTPGTRHVERTSAAHHTSTSNSAQHWLGPRALRSRSLRRVTLRCDLLGISKHLLPLPELLVMLPDQFVLPHQLRLQLPGVFLQYHLGLVVVDEEPLLQEERLQLSGNVWTQRVKENSNLKMQILPVN